MNPVIVRVERNDDLKCLRTTWNTGSITQFPYVWLRDNSPASHTYQLSEICKGRKMVMTDLDVAVEPTSVELIDQTLRIVWPPDLTTHYSSEWLRERNIFDARVKTNRRSLDLSEKILWSADKFRSHLRWHSFAEILLDDAKLLDCLQDLLKFGLVLMNQVPTELGQLERLTGRIGLGYPTHYGPFFSVKSDVNPTNVAYTSGPIGLHIDLPYLEYPPQIQVLHCIEQSKGEGGDSLFADGFQVYEQMKVEQPQQCQTLTDVELEYWDDGATGDLRYKLTHKWPVFNLDKNGDIKQIIYSNQMRSWFYDVHTATDLQSIFTAIKAFDNRLHSDTNLFRFKMNAGELCMFDNLRVLHGRSGFQVGGASGSRLLEGCYFNWDFVRSKIRVLQSHLGLFDQVTI